MNPLIRTAVLLLALWPGLSGRAQDFIRPAAEPDRLDFAYRRIKALENDAGHYVQEIEYSLPVDTELVVSVIVRKDGKLSADDSGTFHITAKAEEKRNRGILSATLLTKTGNAAGSLMYYISLDNGYSYGVWFSKEAQNSKLIRSEINPAPGQKDQQIFLHDFGEKFSLELRAHTVLRTEADPLNTVRREPYAGG
jgi:hypothetical protein